MVAHENRLLSTVDELFDAQAVSYEDDHVTRERGSTAYDTTGLSNVPIFTATQSSAGANWGAILATFSGSSIAVGGTASQNGDTTAVFLLLVPAGGYAIDTLVTAAVILQGAGASAASIVSVTDNQANTWTLQGSTSIEIDGSGNTNFLALYTSRITTALSAGNTVAFTLDGTYAVKGVMRNFSGVTSGTPDNVETNASTTGTITVGPTPPLTTLPQLLVGIAAANQAANTETLTPASGFTEDIETTGAGNGTTDISLNHRIDTTVSNIIAQYDWYSDVETTPAGTVTTVQGSDTVEGAGTTFTNHAPGDRIVVANETRVIESITDNDTLVTTEAWTSSNAGVAYKIRVGNRLITATSGGGNLFKEKPLTLTTGDLDATTLKSGLSLVARPGFFVAGGKEAAAVNRKLFYFNGVDEVQVLSGDGTSTTDIATPPVDWDTVSNQGKQPVAGVLHENRLAAWGNLNDPHRVYFSDPDDHEDFTSAAAFTVRFRSDIGDRIYCGASFQGVLFVWKFPRGIFYLDDTDPDTDNWSVRVKSQLVGCAPTPYAIVPMEDDVIFMAADGSFHLLSSVSDLGGVQASNLSQALGLSKFLRDTLNLARLGLTVSAYHQHKKTAYFACPGAGDVDNTVLLKFDFGLVSRGGPVRFSYDVHYAPGSLTVRRDLQGGPETPILGESGFAYLLDQETRSKNGAAYTTSLATPHLDFGDLNVDLRWQEKHYDHLEFAFEPDGASGTATVDVYVDGTLRESFSVDVTQTRVKRALTVGAGHTIKVVLSQSAAGENFKLLGAWVYFRAGNSEVGSR